MFSKNDNMLSFKGQALKLNTFEDGEKIAEKIRNFKNLEILELSGNTLSVDASEPIADALRNHKELKKALWSDLFTGRLNTEIPIVLKNLCDAMEYAGIKLKVLDLSDNAIGPQAIGGLEKFLSGPSCFELKELYLNNCGLGAAGINVANCLINCFEAALRAKTVFSLEVFIAGRNRLENRGAKALAKAFEKLGSLVEVRMYQNGILADGITALANGFSHCLKLKILDLNDNTFGRNGAIAMSRVVGKLNELQVLDFGDCLCRRKGSEAIVQSLASSNSPIEKLSLNGNEIDAESAKKIIQMCTTLPNLQELILFQNSYGSEFDELKEKFVHSFVNLGEESDDDGSRDGDTEVELSDVDDELIEQLEKLMVAAKNLKCTPPPPVKWD